jgi:uncharacterized membrane-anchored protein
MTSTQSTTGRSSTGRDVAVSRTPLLAALGLGTALVLNAVGTFWSAGDAEHGLGSFLVVAAVSAVATALVFGLVVRTAARGDAGRRAVVLGALGALSFVVFWAGITAPLAFGALACALVARDRDRQWSPVAAAAVALALLALAAVAVLAVVG